MKDNLLESLNTPQREAVELTEGPLIIVAGAGSGKTKVITHRIANIIRLHLAKPDNILALTFTNKAAREMKTRISSLLDSSEVKGLWIGTFHSNFAKLLRIHAKTIGYTQDFTIYDSDDVEKIIKVLLLEIGLTPKEIGTKAIQGRISFLKNKLISSQAFSQEAKNYLDDVVSKIFLKYEEKLFKNNAMDFDDLLVKPIELFKKEESILKQYQEKFKYLMVDEYQDTNYAQYMVIKMLSEKNKNICVVGDDSQSIYSWRGADIENILRFEKDYHDSKLIKLNQNYRCTKSILAAANSVISKNKNQIKKELTTENENGEKIIFSQLENEIIEGVRVAQIIRELKLKYGWKNSDFAVFYRTNYQSRSFEDGLRQNGIPYRIYGGVSFYKRKEIKDVTAYLRLITNFSDEESLSRIINYPPRGIGDVTLSKVILKAREENLQVFDILSKPASFGFSERASLAIKEFYDVFHYLVEISKKCSVVEVIEKLYEKTKWIEYLKREESVESNSKILNLEEFLSFATYFSKNKMQEDEVLSLQSFLQEVLLASDLEEADDENKVSLMTIHSAKGLEFPVVFVVGLEDGLFPLSVETHKELEEERRLFYVAITRAKKRLFLSMAKSRNKYGNFQQTLRSRFIGDLDMGVVCLENGLPLSELFYEEKERNRIVRNGTSTEEIKKPVWMESDFELRRLRKKIRGLNILPDSDAEKLSSVEIRIGMSVSHRIFGTGKVIAINGEADEQTALIMFKNAGPALFLAQYVSSNEPFNSLETICKWASDLGFLAIQIPSWDARLIDLKKASESRAYCDEIAATVARYGMEISELSTHLQGQLVAVHPAYSELFSAFVPEKIKNDFSAWQKWSTEQLIFAAKASRLLNLKAHATFSGSLAWPYIYPWPQRPYALVDEAFSELARRWLPILNKFDEVGVDLCYEIHPSEDLHDGVTYEMFLDKVKNHKRACLLFDPSHFVLQCLDYLAYLDHYQERIKMFHVKDAEFRPNGKQGVYGGYQNWENRNGRFRSLGDGQVDFKAIFSKLAQYDFDGWAVLEWECCIKDAEIGAREGAEFIKKNIIKVTERTFDDFSGNHFLNKQSIKKVLGL
ncbi:hypothetical protein CHS0354_024032 [Potamilus streckersoni]|uniref:DNA 3'-5' helicase n=1 Tax=Potamilus streckersoni TaxID=2493646 RepID=A0AAE0RZP4_9BIVA|nr:hypothetical protein CHS0354_024032 [Potamilus streckersoni]